MAALNAEIPDDLKKALDVACAERRLPLRSATEMALKDWLGLGDDQDDGPEDPLVGKLKDILGGDDATAKDLITRTIVFFHERRVRTRRGAPKQRALASCG